MEFATRWQLNEIWRGSRNGYKGRPVTGEGRDSFNQADGIGMTRVTENRAHISNFDDLRRIYSRDAIGQRGCQGASVGNE